MFYNTREKLFPRLHTLNYIKKEKKIKNED